MPATVKNNSSADLAKASRSAGCKPAGGKPLSPSAGPDCKSARDALVLRYLPLAYAMARRISLPFEDAAQEAIIGLIRAADRFDESRNTAFSTYARYWITEALQRAAIQALPVHIPLHVAKKAAAARNAAANNWRFNDDAPQNGLTDGSLADGGLTDGGLADGDLASNGFMSNAPANEAFTDFGSTDLQPTDLQPTDLQSAGLPPAGLPPAGRKMWKRTGSRRLDYAFAMTNVHPVRVEMEYEDGEPRHEEVSANNPWQEKESRMDADRIKANLRRLSIRQQHALALYYGIGGRDGHDGCTLDETGNIMNISREAVRQLIVRGVDLLREFHR